MKDEDQNLLTVIRLGPEHSHGIIDPRIYIFIIIFTNYIYIFEI